MSIHLGVAHGPVDAITGLFCGEKLAWTGEVTASGNVQINAPNLFGGPKSQGGVGGVMTFLNGDDTQVMPAALASRLGTTSALCPGFRGVCSVFFTGYTNVASGSIDLTGGAAAPVSGSVGGNGNSSGSGSGNGSSGGGSVGGNPGSINPRYPQKSD